MGARLPIFAAFWTVLFFSADAQAQTKPPETQWSTGQDEQVVCVVCGDYTFDKRHAVPGTYEGKKISLCSLKELELLKENPDKYVWASDPVSGARVHKIQTSFTADRKVQVRKKDGKIETWPRRFFFESAKTRDRFLKKPERFLREPYQVD